MQEEYQEYQFLLKSQNTSSSFQRLLEHKMGNQEVIFTTICQFSKLPVITPVRHTHLNYIHCVFELEYWLEHYKQMNKKVDPNGFACPGCRNYVNFKDYGVDYNYYHILEQLQLFKIKNPDIKINTSQIIYIPSSKTYYVEQKITQKRFQLPGSKPESTKRLQGLNKVSFQSEQSFIVEEMNKTLVKLQSLIYSKIYRIIKQPKNNNKLTFKDLQQQIALRKQNLRQVFNNSMKLISLGRQSLSNDYVFAIKKKITNNQVQSILIVYFVSFGIWQEFPLKFKGQPYIQLEQSLYIKGESNNTNNHIYIVGGIKGQRFSYSNQVLMISFPKFVFQNGEEAKIIELPNLPKEGYNFMGTCFKQQLYIFYGQIQLQTQDNSTKYEQLNSQYVFKNNCWEQMKLKLVERIDGSFFTLKHNLFEKLIIFYGGISKQSDYLSNHAVTQQGQIFICKDEQFIGDKQQEFKINFLDQDPYHKNVLASSIISCPYYGTKQLLLSGEKMKSQNTQQRQIYTFDYENATLKLNELFCLEPSEYILSSYERKTINKDMFSPIQDYDGVVIYGNFYVIHQYELEQSIYDKNPQVIVQLLKINLTNGQFNSIPYLDSTISKEIADKIYQKLEDKLNQEIN